MKNKVIIISLLLLFSISFYLLPCTIFFGSQNNLTLGGNNEDWSDSNTKMWIIPSQDRKWGWIKFGFAGGYPQGGMNEHGLFWDATACPYLAMPFSEANKQLYEGSLMQKVIEECANLQEALAVFDNYYCNDQYDAQYLVGDSNGYSAIVEGDEIISSGGDYQVMTNFYQSHPELGGYPCWRYDTAVEMLMNSDKFSTYLFGSVLSATHQEGQYPTQYSNIYDLKNKIVYLFYFHNFEEFITIKLKEELKIGNRDYHIPSLFSKIEIVSPDNDTVLNPASVTFTWRGKKNSSYEIYCSTDPDYKGCEPIPVLSSYTSGFGGTSITFFCLGLILMGSRKKCKARMIFFVVLLIMLLTLISCQSTTSVSDNDIGEISITLENLESGSTYYWKVTARAEGVERFTSETTVHSFITFN